MPALIGLIQRPRRKQHLAVLPVGSQTWGTLGSCRLNIPVDGTDFTPIDRAEAIGTAHEQNVDVCIPCLHLIAFAQILEVAQFTTRHVEAVA
jgi:hypothetical protein